jgi:XTP/dITP diphosphohydrolase
MQVVVATSNPHKLEEIHAVFSACASERDRTDPERVGYVAAGKPSSPIELLTLATARAAELAEPVEDGDTFEANAIIKARYYATHTKLPCIADDSGLEVDALNGDPGVRSARYSGATGGRGIVDPANNRRLLRELGQRPTKERAARFVCAMAFALPDVADVLIVRGTVEGRILGPGDEGFYAADVETNFRGRGSNGFGYDPLFLVPSLGKTTAELSPEHKNAISHRGDASRKLWAMLRDRGIV